MLGLAVVQTVPLEKRETSFHRMSDFDIMGIG
jgi:hypothetical protein